ncbi:hypothetical protein D3C71_349010 [compost metagenome]
MENESIAWLKSIYPNFKEEAWHNNRVLHPLFDVPNRKFYDNPIFYEEEIDPSWIVGIDYYPDYNFPWNDTPVNLTWIELFQNLKRLDRLFRFKTFDELIDHIDNCPESKTVIKFGDQYYTTGGQHRLCLAKLLKVEKVKVQVFDYQFNQQLFDTHTVIEKHFSALSAYRLVSYRKSNEDYLNGVKIELNKHEFTIPVRLIESFLDIYNHTLIEGQFINRLKSFVTIYFEHRSADIKATDDLRKLKAYIFLHKLRMKTSKLAP